MKILADHLHYVAAQHEIAGLYQRNPNIDRPKIILILTHITYNTLLYYTYIHNHLITVSCRLAHISNNSNST